MQILQISKIILNFATNKCRQSVMKLNKQIFSIFIAAAAIAAPIEIIAAEAVAPGQVSSVQQDTPQVKAQPGGVNIEIPGEQPRHVAIYAITGQVVKQFNANPGSTYVELPAGYYIVRVANLSIKIVVK